MAEPVLNASDTKMQQTVSQMLRAGALSAPRAGTHPQLLQPGTAKLFRTNYITTQSIFLPPSFTNAGGVCVMDCLQLRLHTFQQAIFTFFPPLQLHPTVNIHFGNFYFRCSNLLSFQLSLLLFQFLQKEDSTMRLFF